MIEINNLSYSYGKKEVLSHISLRFEKGNIYGLLGENGVGKTTLLKLTCGLLRPRAGSCTLEGIETFARKPQTLQSFFFLPDEVHLPDSTTPKLYFQEFAPFYPNANSEALEKYATELKIDIDRKFKEMSYGQQKKALLAACLALNVEYLLLDEPTNGLDIPSKADFRRILSQYTTEQHCIIISTHQVRDVENLIDPIVIISNNRVLLNATMEQIANALRFEYTATSDPQALYSEMQPNGWLNVYRNEDQSEGNINIEALFNTVLINQDKIDTLFNRANQ